MPLRHGSGAVILTPAPWYRDRPAATQGRAPSSGPAATAPAAEPAAEPQRRKRKCGKPRGTRDPTTVALKKSRRWAQRHRKLPIASDEAIQRQALNNLDHPDLIQTVSGEVEEIEGSSTEVSGSEDDYKGSSEALNKTSYYKPKPQFRWPVKQEVKTEVKEEKVEATPLTGANATHLAPRPKYGAASASARGKDPATGAAERSRRHREKRRKSADGQ
jgi:hypothetical protein